jgi:hypothetical protein
VKWTVNWSDQFCGKPIQLHTPGNHSCAEQSALRHAFDPHFQYDDAQENK